jgi:hypothetical protein
MRRLIALMCCALVSVACVPRASPPVHSGCALRVEADVSRPYRLLSTVLLVDGEVVARSPGQVRLDLRPGPHELAVAARLSRPCELAADHVELTHVRAATTVMRSPAAIEVRVVAGPLTAASLEASADGAPFAANLVEPGCCSIELVEAPEALPSSACRVPPDAGVLVIGEVQHPRELEWRRGMTAYDAISAAGGATRLANLRYTQVHRRCGAVLEVPWYAPASSLELQPGDDVVVRMTPDP